MRDVFTAVCSAAWRACKGEDLKPPAGVVVELFRVGLLTGYEFANSYAKGGSPMVFKVRLRGRRNRTLCCA